MHPIIAGCFDAGQPGYYLLILVFMAALVGLYLWGNRRRDQESRVSYDIDSFERSGAFDSFHR